SFMKMAKRFQCVKRCCSNTTIKSQKLLIALRDPRMVGLVTVMSLFVVLGATKNLDFILDLKMNVAFTMIPWQMQTGHVLIFHMIRYH
ncbi:hypothetical protein RYX36_005815, partial [Vicia faba]